MQLVLGGDEAPLKSNCRLQPPCEVSVTVSGPLPFTLSLETHSFSEGLEPLRAILAEFVLPIYEVLFAEHFRHVLETIHLSSFTCSPKTVTLAEN